MSRKWNGKALVDELATRLWDCSDANKERIITWANEIQDDIVSDMPIDFYKFKLKKLFPVQQEIISMNIETPSAPISSLINSPAGTISYNSSNASLVYDPALIEVSAGDATLKALSADTDEMITAKFNSVVNADRGQGTLVPIGDTGVSIVGNKLDLTGGTVQYLIFNPDNYTPNDGRIGCIRCKYTADYTGSPPVHQYMVDINGPTNANRVQLANLSAGTIRLSVYDNSGTLILTVQESYAMTSGVELEIEANYDLVSGDSSIFIDGVRLGSSVATTTATVVDNTGITAIIIGNREPLNASPDFYIRDVELFDSVKHTANFASEIPRVVSIYSTDSPSIITETNSVFELSSLLESVTTPALTSVKYIIIQDAVEKYHDGANWVASDGSALQSNTATEITTNALDLLSATASIGLKTFLINTSEIDRPLIVSNTINSLSGELETGASYMAYVTFKVYSPTGEYMESEAGNATNEIVTTATGKALTLSSIPIFGGALIVPNDVHRTIYLSKKAVGESSYGEPFYSQDIEDNTTTTVNILADSTSTITPPSDSEVDQLASDSPWNLKVLERQDMDDIRRYNPQGSESATPSYFDYIGTDRIKLYPKLSSGATEAQRTFNYFVHRRPHEVFYTKERNIDLPIAFKKALIEGVLWKGYEFRDRDGHVSKLNNYMNFKKEALNKIRRLKNRPSVVRDVTGDTFGYEV